MIVTSCRSHNIPAKRENILTTGQNYQIVIICVFFFKTCLESAKTLMDATLDLRESDWIQTGITADPDDIFAHV